MPQDPEPPTLRL